MKKFAVHLTKPLRLRNTSGMKIRRGNSPKAELLDQSGGKIDKATVNSALDRILAAMTTVNGELDTLLAKARK